MKTIVYFCNPLFTNQIRNDKENMDVVRVGCIRLRKMVMKIVDEEKENILESLPTNNEMTIVELTKNTLKVSDEEIVLDLKRVN